jgi:hypothetical protein
VEGLALKEDGRGIDGAVELKVYGVQVQRGLGLSQQAAAKRQEGSKKSFHVYSFGFAGAKLMFFTQKMQEKCIFSSFRPYIFWHVVYIVAASAFCLFRYASVI